MAAAFLDDDGLLHLSEAARALLEAPRAGTVPAGEALAALAHLDGSALARGDLCEHPLTARTPSGAQVQLVLCPAPGGCSVAIQALLPSPVSLPAARALLERSGDVLALVDAAGTIVWASEAMEALHGVTARQAVGASGFAFVHPDDMPRIREELTWRVATPGPHRSLTYRAAHADGSWRHLEMRSTNLLHDPDVAALVVCLRDITTDVRRRRIAVEVTAALEAMMSGEEPADVLTLLESAATHYIEDEHPGRRVTAAFDLDAAIGAALSHCGASPTTPTLATVGGLRIEGGDLELSPLTQQMLASLTVYTELLVTFAADRHKLASSAAQYTSGFRNNPVAAAIIGLDGKFLRANPAMAELTGIPQEELMTLGWRDLIHPEAETPPDAPMTGSRADMPNAGMTSRWLLPGGRDVWVDVWVTAVTDHTGQLQYHIVTYHDVTEMQELVRTLESVNATLRERAELSDAERSRLAALVADLADDRERERATWATRLTEDAVQQLVGTRFALDSLPVASDDPAVSQASGLLERVISELREAAGAMRPATLDLFGLEPALRLAGESLIGQGTQTTLDLEPLPRLRSEDEILVYRAILAGVAAAQRPGVARARITLARSADDDVVDACYLDDGPGAARAAVDDPTFATLQAQFTARGWPLYVGPRRDGGPGLEVNCTIAAHPREDDTNGDDAEH